MLLEKLTALLSFNHILSYSHPISIFRTFLLLLVLIFTVFIFRVFTHIGYYVNLITL